MRFDLSAAAIATEVAPQNASASLANISYVTMSVYYATSASNAYHAETASYATTAIYAGSASHADVADTSSYAHQSTNASTASWALTSSYAVLATTASHFSTATLAISAISASQASESISSSHSLISDLARAIDFTPLSATSASYASASQIAYSLNFTPTSATSASYASSSLSASHAILADAAEVATSSSYAAAATSASLALISNLATGISFKIENSFSASYASESISSSHALRANIANAINFTPEAANSSSYASESLSSSYAETSEIALSIGFVPPVAVSSSYASASTSASWAPSPTFVETATSASYASTSFSASWAELAYAVVGGVTDAINAVSSSFASASISASIAAIAEIATSINFIPLSATSASYASASLSASWSPTPESVDSSSYATISETARAIDFIPLSATSASYASESLSSSYAGTAGVATSINFTPEAATSSSYSSASFSASYALAAAAILFKIENVFSASYASESVSSSHAITSDNASAIDFLPIAAESASYASESVSSSYAEKSDTSISSSYSEVTLTSSYAASSSWAFNVVGGSQSSVSSSWASASLSAETSSLAETARLIKYEPTHVVHVISSRDLTNDDDGKFLICAGTGDIILVASASVLSEGFACKIIQSGSFPVIVGATDGFINFGSGSNPANATDGNGSWMDVVRISGSSWLYYYGDKLKYSEWIVPNAPSNMVLTHNTGSLTASWDDNSSDELGFALYFGTSIGGMTQIASLSPETTLYATSNITQSTTYYSCVKAWNSYGTSSASNTASVVIPSYVPPTPDGMTLIAGTGSISSSWNDVVNETNYDLLRGTSIGGMTSLKTTAANITYSRDVANDETEYFYCVKAWNTYGTSSASNTASVTTPKGAVVFPTITGLWARYAAREETGYSDNDPIASWTDQSGNGHHVTQSNNDNKPTYKTNVINGQSVIRFDGTNDLFYRGDWGDADNTTMSYCFVIQPVSDPSTPFYGFDDGEAFVGIFNGGKISFYNGGGYIETPAISLPYTSSQIFIVSHESHGACKLETTAYNYTGSSGCSTSPPVTRVWIGAYAGGLHYFEGDIPEAAFFNKTLSASEKALLLNYWKSTYGITN